MDALKVALETVLVGALALPWLALAVEFFFPKAKDWTKEQFSFGTDQIWSTVASVLLVAMIYFLGASVSRLAQDFFNDEDLPLHLPTENEIRGSVYCPADNRWIIDPGISSQEKREGLPPVAELCKQSISAGNRKRDSARDQIRQIFNLEESKLLLAGEDKTSRLRLIHQQIVVLRGATFNGLIVCALCFLGWNAEKQSWKQWRWVIPSGLILYVLYGLLCNHLQLCQHPSLLSRHEFADPPFMELGLLLVGVGGCYMIVREAKQPWPKGAGLASLLLTTLAYSGWYWSEIMYDEVVINSFYASQHLISQGLHP